MNAPGTPTYARIGCVSRLFCGQWERGEQREEGELTKTVLLLMFSKVKVFSALSSLTGTLIGIVEPTFASAAVRRDVASECAVLVAPDRMDAIFEWDEKEKEVGWRRVGGR